LPQSLEHYPSPSILMPNDGTRPKYGKPPFIRDWHGGFLGTDLARHGVQVRMGRTWQKRRRKRKAWRQKARAEGRDEPRGRPGIPQKSTVERGRDGAPYISPSIFCGGGSVGSRPQMLIERNRPHCGINARCKRGLERPRRRPWALWDGIGAASDPSRRIFRGLLDHGERRSPNTLGAL
jgi:hypothetical protein